MAKKHAVERWKNLPGKWFYFYQVSNFGRVKSCPRTTVDGRKLHERMLKKSVVLWNCNFFFIVPYKDPQI